MRKERGIPERSKIPLKELIRPPENSGIHKLIIELKTSGKTVEKDAGKLIDTLYPELLLAVDVDQLYFTQDECEIDNLNRELYPETSEEAMKLSDDIREKVKGKLMEGDKSTIFALARVRERNILAHIKELENKSKMAKKREKYSTGKSQDKKMESYLNNWKKRKLQVYGDLQRLRGKLALAMTRKQLIQNPGLNNFWLCHVDDLKFFEALGKHFKGRNLNPKDFPKI